MIDGHRLVYLSRNELSGDTHPDAALEQILAASRRNNAALGVTGSLMFNAGVFAQVLEGSRPLVEALFERIQRDPRHAQVRILQFEPVPERLFAAWAMAWVGRDAGPLPEFGDAGTPIDRLEISGDRVLQLLGRHLDDSEASVRAA